MSFAYKNLNFTVFLGTAVIAVLGTNNNDGGTGVNQVCAEHTGDGCVIA